MTVTSISIEQQGQAARKASRELARASTEARNAALSAIAFGLEERVDEVLLANREDIAAAGRAGQDFHITERMTLDRDRVASMAAAVRTIEGLPDPVGEIIEKRTMPNGLDIERVRVPLGVIGVIYESRPNVTVDIASLCLKSGNAVILRGGKEAIRTNTVLARIARDGVEAAGLPGDAVQFVESTDRTLVKKMLEMDKYIDLLIPRGSAELVHMVAENATMPAVTGGIGVCHTYVDAAADTGKAVEIVFNAKVQRPTVCNALDTVLVHAEAAPRFLPVMAGRFAAAGVEMRVDKRALALIGPKKKGAIVKLAESSDFGQEFLALVASVRVVDSFEDAIEHIETYGSGHSEAIVTDDAATAERFLREVDAAAVFANASTRFNDGGEFGFGAEVAISTNKLHARGPMGLREICSYKWVVRGDGHVRG